MTFRFRSLKTTQAAAVLLALDDNSMDRMRLLKLLYIVDRELLAESGRTLTGDRAVAMKNGPVLSRIYGLIKGTELSPADWGRYLRSAGYKVVLLEDPGQGELTKREIAKLHDVTERYRSVPTPALSAHTHRFPEWKNNYNVGTATPIPWQDALVPRFGSGPPGYRFVSPDMWRAGMVKPSAEQATVYSNNRPTATSP